MDSVLPTSYDGVWLAGGRLPISADPPLARLALAVERVASIRAEIAQAAKVATMPAVEIGVAPDMRAVLAVTRTVAPCPLEKLDPSKSPPFVRRNSLAWMVSEPAFPLPASANDPIEL